MKKLFVFLGLLLVVCGCGRSDDKNIVKDLKKRLDGASAYHMTGTLEIFRNEEKYTYDVDSSYSKGDLFKVNLVNQNNNHEQIILRNDQGIYVITPSLNKSFKFQSDWPYNNSQIYLLQPIITDLTNDKNIKIEKNNNEYILTSKVNYSSEKDFSKQKVYLDKDKNITKIEVLDDKDNIKMSLSIIDIDYKAKFDGDYFDANKYQSESLKDNNTTSDSNLENNNQESKSENPQSNNESNNNQTNQEATTSKIEDIVYPM